MRRAMMCAGARLRTTLRQLASEATGCRRASLGLRKYLQSLFRRPSLSAVQQYRVSDSPSQPEEMPPPTAELVLLRVHVEALLSSMRRKQAEKYLRIVSEILATEETLAQILPLQARSHHAALNQARRGALYWFRAALPTFIARLPKE